MIASHNNCCTFAWIFPRNLIYLTGHTKKLLCIKGCWFGWENRQVKFPPLFGTFSYCKHYLITIWLSMHSWHCYVIHKITQHKSARQQVNENKINHSHQSFPLKTSDTLLHKESGKDLCIVFTMVKSKSKFLIMKTLLLIY